MHSAREGENGAVQDNPQGDGLLGGLVIDASIN